MEDSRPCSAHSSSQDLASRPTSRQDFIKYSAEGEAGYYSLHWESLDSPRGRRIPSALTISFMHVSAQNHKHMKERFVVAQRKLSNPEFAQALSTSLRKYSRMSLCSSPAASRQSSATERLSSPTRGNRSCDSPHSQSADSASSLNPPEPHRRLTCQSTAATSGGKHNIPEQAKASASQDSGSMAGMDQLPAAARHQRHQKPPCHRHYNDVEQQCKQHPQHQHQHQHHHSPPRRQQVPAKHTGEAPSAAAHAPLGPNSQLQHAPRQPASLTLLQLQHSNLNTCARLAAAGASATQHQQSSGLPHADGQIFGHVSLEIEPLKAAPARSAAPTSSSTALNHNLQPVTAAYWQHSNMDKVAEGVNALESSDAAAAAAAAVGRIVASRIDPTEAAVAGVPTGGAARVNGLLLLHARQRLLVQQDLRVQLHDLQQQTRQVPAWLQKLELLGRRCQAGSAAVQEWLSLWLGQQRSSRQQDLDRIDDQLHARQCDFDADVKAFRGRDAAAAQRRQAAAATANLAALEAADRARKAQAKKEGWGRHAAASSGRPSSDDEKPQAGSVFQQLWQALQGAKQRKITQRAAQQHEWTQHGEKDVYDPRLWRPMRRTVTASQAAFAADSGAFNCSFLPANSECMAMQLGYETEANPMGYPGLWTGLAVNAVMGLVYGSKTQREVEQDEVQQQLEARLRGLPWKQRMRQLRLAAFHWASQQLQYSMQEQQLEPECTWPGLEREGGVTEMAWMLLLATWQQQASHERWMEVMLVAALLRFCCLSMLIFFFHPCTLQAAAAGLKHFRVGLQTAAVTRQRTQQRSLLRKFRRHRRRRNHFTLQLTLNQPQSQLQLQHQQHQQDLSVPFDPYDSGSGGQAGRGATRRRWLQGELGQVRRQWRRWLMRQGFDAREAAAVQWVGAGNAPDPDGVFEDNMPFTLAGFVAEGLLEHVITTSQVDHEVALMQRTPQYIPPPPAVDTAAWLDDFKDIYSPSSCSWLTGWWRNSSGTNSSSGTGSPARNKPVSSEHGGSGGISWFRSACPRPKVLAARCDESSEDVQVDGRKPGETWEEYWAEFGEAPVWETSMAPLATEDAKIAAAVLRAPLRVGRVFVEQLVGQQQQQQRQVSSNVGGDVSVGLLERRPMPWPFLNSSGIPCGGHINDVQQLQDNDTDTSSECGSSCGSSCPPDELDRCWEWEREGGGGLNDAGVIWRLRGLAKLTGPATRSSLQTAAAPPASQALETESERRTQFLNCWRQYYPCQSDYLASKHAELSAAAAGGHNGVDQLPAAGALGSNAASNMNLASGFGTVGGSSRLSLNNHQSLHHRKLAGP